MKFLSTCLDTLVFYNIHKFHTDPEYWGDPEVFRPERFLHTQDGKMKLVKHDRFLPFGFGKRICMGESLAKAELFIFTVLLIQVVNYLPQTPLPTTYVPTDTKTISTRTCTFCPRSTTPGRI